MVVTESLNKYGVSSIIREFVMVLFIAGIIWISAGFQLWMNAWIYIIFLLIFSAFFMVIMVRKNPGLLNLRGAPRKAMREGNMQRYDKIFFAFYVPLFVLIPIVAGLDFSRFFGLYPFFLFPLPLWLVLIGLILVIIGECIFAWAMVANPFFHGMMKIQDERGHQVVTQGPYQWVRHPGYLGQILFYLGSPLLLGSWWACLLGVIMGFVFIYRTLREDQALFEELKGYDKYTEAVQKRLIPGIW